MLLHVGAGCCWIHLSILTVPCAPQVLCQDQIIFVWKKNLALHLTSTIKVITRHDLHLIMLDGIAHVTVNETCPIK